MSEDKKCQDLSAAELEQVPGGGPLAKQESDVKELSTSELEKVAGGAAKKTSHTKVD